MERKYGRLRRIGNMVRAFCALLCMLLLGGGALAQETPFYTQMPQYLRVTQSTRTEKIKENISVLRTYPDTQNDEVDAQMRLLVDEMAERNRQHLPTDKTNKSSFLDVGSVVRRTGTSVLSFLTTAQVSRERMQLSIDFETRVFDIETGALLALGDLFEPASGVWETLAGHVRAQLSAAFPGKMADEERLGQLCSEAALKEADFTLGAAFLTLTYRADALYPGNNTLLHVHVPYSEIRGLMTEYAQRQTDNSPV